jgi:dTDP-4-dehydrorhamnose reductase
MKKIAITGATGLVGSRVVELLKDNFQFIPLSSKELDITSKDQVNEKLKDLDFDLLLHLAAYTNVDGAETEKEKAYNLNVNGTKYLLDAVLEKKAEFIYISTGFIFDGTKPPYYEDSIAHPTGYYGQTKFEGEQLVKDRGMIVRIEYPYGNSPAPKKDIAHVLKSLLEQGKTLTMIENSLITPTLIDDIAFGLKHLMNSYSSETFHLVGATALSPFNLAKTIARTFNLDENLVKPTTLEEYFKGKAHRPQFADVRSKKNNFSKMRTFEEGIKTLK